MGVETALLVGGTLASAAGSMMAASGSKAAGKAARQTAEYNKAIRDRNARLADQNAEFRERATGQQEVRFRKRFAALQAQAGTAYRKSGVIASSGTPLEVMMRNATDAEEDIELNRRQGATEAGQMREQGVGERLQGQLILLAGKQKEAALKAQARGHMFSAISTIAFGGYKIGQIN
jgi:hypothetical protein